jgi:hypothetical protein
VEHVDWRAYAATKGLSEKQQKVADKIRKRELRVQHLQREIEKIKVGEGHREGRPAMVPQARSSQRTCRAGKRCMPKLCLMLWQCNACARLQAKEQQMEELSSGQASVLVR